MFKKITIIANPISGGKKDRKKIIDFVYDFFSRNCRDCQLKLTAKQGDACDFSKLCSDQNNDLVVVIGGDGTLNEVTNALVHTEVAIGIIPAGSGNGLARSLGIPQNVEEACNLIWEGNIQAIDVGRVNDRYFCLILGLGFDALVGQHFAEHHKRGPASYFYLSAREFLGYKPEKLEISFADRSFEIEPFLIAIANGQQYGNNALIAPNAKLNDGILDISIIRQLKFNHLLSAVPKLFSGQIDRFSEIEIFRAKSVFIERDRAGLVNIDGEPYLEGAELNISVFQKCLQVIVPPNSPALI